MPNPRIRSVTIYRAERAAEQRHAELLEQMQQRMEDRCAWARGMEEDLAALSRLVMQIRTHIDHGDAEKAVRALDDSGDPMWRELRRICR